MVNGIGESKLAVAGQGDVNVVATANGKNVKVTMRGVLFVPGLRINLFFNSIVIYLYCHLSRSGDQPLFNWISHRRGDRSTFCQQHRHFLP
jgi:hypothetical protein